MKMESQVKLKEMYDRLLDLNAYIQSELEILSYTSDEIREGDETLNENEAFLVDLLDTKMSKIYSKQREDVRHSVFKDIFKVLDAINN